MKMKNPIHVWIDDAKKQGEKKGEKKGILQTAKRMFAKKFDIKLISSITGLSISELNKFKGKEN